MSATAIVCPHCSQRQSDRDFGAPSRAAPKKKPQSLSVTKEEAAALFEVKGISSRTMQYERPLGPMALILPRAEASGWVRGLEWLLTALALPLFLGGFLALILRPWMWRRISQTGEITSTLAIGTTGGMGLVGIGFATGVGNALLLGLVGMSFGALIARLVVRSMRPH